MRVIPSPCLIVHSGTSITEGLRLMQDSQLSYLLLKNGEDVVTGIFTKTDLLKIVVSSKDVPQIYTRPFHQLMTKPLRTLPLSLIHTAPEFMLANRIDHVPITERNPETGSEDIIGIITSRSVFEFMVKLRGMPPLFGGETVRREKRNIGVLGADGSIFRLLERIFSNSFYVLTERFRFSRFDFKTVADNVDALVVDIDDVEKRVWFPVVEAAVRNPNLESVCLVYDPLKHEDVADKLRTLESSGFFRLYEKPLDVSRLTTDLEKIWAKIIPIKSTKKEAI